MIYILTLILFTTLLGVVSFFFLSDAFSALKGAPFVPTSFKEVNAILAQGRLKKGQLFLDLGCGDGRVVRRAVKNYGVLGLGIDINPFLIFWAKLLNRLQHTPEIQFVRGNIFKTSLQKADAIFLFLMPQMIAKLQDKLIAEVKEGTLIISHGFAIPKLAGSLISTRASKPFPTYFYTFKRIKKG